jgi:hypothetical protein
MEARNMSAAATSKESAREWLQRRWGARSPLPDLQAIRLELSRAAAEAASRHAGPDEDNAFRRRDAT